MKIKSGTPYIFPTDCVCVRALSHMTLCNPVDCSPPGYSVHGIFQARVLEQLPFPSPGDLSYPGIKSMSPVSPALAGRFFASGKPSTKG